MARERSHSKSSRGVGDSHESGACRYLQRHGLKLVKRNYYCQLGEIDLVMTDASQFLVFIEIRYRRNLAFGDPIATITASKQRKCRLAASHFLSTHPRLQHLACRFDVVGVSPSATTGKLQYEWISHAFV